MGRHAKPRKLPTFHHARNPGSPGNGLGNPCLPLAAKAVQSADSRRDANHAVASRLNARWSHVASVPAPPASGVAFAGPSRHSAEYSAQRTLSAQTPHRLPLSPQSGRRTANPQLGRRHVRSPERASLPHEVMAVDHVRVYSPAGPYAA